MESPTIKKIILVTGPTASGKTAVAIALAKHFQTEIISADSRQCYRELNIGVARPSEQELAAVPHHFIASHSIQEEVTAADFEKYALTKAAEIFQTNDQLIMVGGTGLYIRAFCEGFDAVPAIDPEIRKKITTIYSVQGLNWLQEEIKQKDPQFYKEGEIQNPQRMMRALEVVETTGQSILSFQKGNKASRDFTVVRIGLDIPKPDLHNNIHSRVDKMMQVGLLEEVRSLLPYRQLNALRTVGYTELFEFLDGTITKEKAIEQIKTNTRQYAKRQLTWFRRDEEIRWFSPGEIGRMVSLVG